MQKKNSLIVTYVLRLCNKLKANTFGGHRRARTSARTFGARLGVRTGPVVGGHRRARTSARTFGARLVVCTAPAFGGHRRARLGVRTGPSSTQPPCDFFFHCRKNVQEVPLSHHFQVPVVVPHVHRLRATDGDHFPPIFSPLTIIAVPVAPETPRHVQLSG